MQVLESPGNLEILVPKEPVEPGRITSTKRTRELREPEKPGESRELPAPEEPREPDNPENRKNQETICVSVSSQVVWSHDVSCGYYTRDEPVFRTKLRCPSRNFLRFFSFFFSDMTTCFQLDKQAA